MSLTLHYHPLSSFCWKTLIALYETGTPFTPQLVDLGNADSRAAFYALWPIGKFPVLRDEARNITLPESTIIIEYLDRYYPGKAALLPKDSDALLQARLQERLYDLYIHIQMQKVVLDNMRPEGQGDAYGVEQAKKTLRSALDVLEKEIDGKTWALGENFSFVDCAAVPALYYGNMALPFESSHPRVARYLERLKARPSVARVLKEAEPYFHLVPGARRQ